MLLSGNLRDRLRRIQISGRNKTGCIQPIASANDFNNKSNNRNTVTVPENAPLSLFEKRGWVSAGFQTLRREIVCGEKIELPETIPYAAGIVMPGIMTYNECCTAYEDLLFFDLETTGLSGGAGTVAFLAAFGRLVPDCASAEKTRPKTAFYLLRITQYLLLDYPGENDFIEALLGEFKNAIGAVGGAGGCAVGCTDAVAGVTMVSYNGKCFDSQILKTRCLMNGIVPPGYRHADLLHPSRRLWKKMLPDCSQGTVETEILGLDRTGDTPGAMAPEIWFSFLRNGDAVPLLEICEHNRRDISGLAAIFSAMAGIAGDPFAAVKKISYDREALSLCWYQIAKRLARNNPKHAGLLETGQKLLAFTAKKGGGRAELWYGLALFGAGKYTGGREWLGRAASEDRPQPVRVQALRALAIDSERRLGNSVEALDLAIRGLEITSPDTPHRFDFEKRVGRLQKKITLPR